MDASQLAALNPSTLDLYIRVVKAGSFSALAAHMNVATSSVSRQIVQLEQALGGQMLLSRTSRGLTPTPAGWYVYHAATLWLDTLTEFQRGMDEFQNEPKGLLRLGCASPVGETVLPLLPGFMRQYSDIRIDLRMADNYLDVVAEKLDLFITLGQPPSGSLIARRLCRGQVGLYAATDYLMRHGTPGDHLALSEHNCLVMQRGGVLENEWLLTEQGHETSVSVHGSFVCNTTSALVRMIADGVGIGMVMEFVIAPFLASGQVQQILTQYEGVSLPHLANQEVYAVYPDKRILQLKARLLIDHLVAQLAPPVLALGGE